MPHYDGTFKAFSETPEYVEVNEICADSWINQILMKNVEVSDVLDIATGVGTMANIFLRDLGRIGVFPNLTCLDIGKWAIELARLHVRVASGVSFIESDIRVATFDKKFDVVTWANGIHYLSPDDQRAAVQKIWDALRPGGFFFFNTAFHTEGIPVETRQFYSAKQREAVRLLRERGVERKKDAPSMPAANPQPASHYLSLVNGNLWAKHNAREYSVRGTLAFWKAIASFHDYAGGALRGYPTTEGAEALVQATDVAFASQAVNSNGDCYIERRWLSVMAQKSY